MSNLPLDITDRRRAGAGDNSVYVVRDTNGAGPDIADLFNDRRYITDSAGNGTGKNVSNGKGRKAA